MFYKFRLGERKLIEKQYGIYRKMYYKIRAWLALIMLSVVQYENIHGFRACIVSTYLAESLGDKAPERYLKTSAWYFGGLSPDAGDEIF